MKNKHIESIKRKVASSVQKIPKVDCVAVGEDPADVIQYLFEFIEGLGYNVYSEEISDITGTYGAIISKKVLTEKQIEAIVYEDLGLPYEEEDDEEDDEE